MIDYLYGRNAVLETLRAARRKVYKLWIAEGVRERGPVTEVLALAQQGGIPWQRVERRQLDKACGSRHHQGLVAEASGYAYAALDEILAWVETSGEPALLLLLDCLQDPQNFGALLRTAEVVGVHGAVMPSRRSVGVTPAVVNASAGAVEHLLVAQVTNLAQSIEHLKRQDVWIVGLEDHPQARSLYSADLDMPLALVVGSEGQGLRRLVRQRCDFVLRLPMRGRINSLNASVAGSVALYEVWRRRGIALMPFAR
ncbi:MAG: 23S rRNA (guanosine(2251)-2'-O)-methyltransferase RlmB [Anaerolineae bacterium]|nr:MAG: 23S rRNA (guanosine(2251)-2'-O)-methyltransferase RlmB [Anaerolineae bacterium]